ncbi:Acetate kinase [Caldithrix abyssi DSM 13497]|uniref:Acetate kinase n=1 Tax=Caldithrix abyssi DSM 13497 TaxID=880073 RepID=H1XSA3_CALAY|nr:acetate kinase [Caldithrix abyssi]APF20208.1 ackA acetate kinase [Caldithrix abyssi DSM 13497]EHO40267.1 Acetate kinase [Caldithrix abyssi DSM 13497]
MIVLVINAGSSSVKYQVIDPEEQRSLARGVVERIGMSGAILTHRKEGEKEVRLSGEILDHKMAIEYVLGILLSKNHGVIKDKSEIDAVGHRVVHGGEVFSGSVLITEEVMAEMRRCIDYAPLHNPPNLKGINAAMQLLPGVPQVGVFDTAFHQTMPKHAYLYGLPYALYKKHGIRRYGFHGTSHRFVSDRAAKMLGRPKEELRIITCHLGNGASAAAIKYGKSIDTSMGFTPLEGLMMGTRSGDLDPAIILQIMHKEELTPNDATTLLNKHSGLIGVSGLSSDMREIEEEYETNARAKLAHDIFTYRLKKYIGAYAAAMGGVDAIVFTGGIGENSSLVRKNALSELEFLGIKLDHHKNEEKSKGERDISAAESGVKVLVIPTNEELVIAMDTMQIVSQLKK